MERKVIITDIEYEKLIKRLEFFDTMRNNLLTFSFTSVLTVLGVALAMDMDLMSSWICLIPFFLIIPFASRISYYRLASAHINSFLQEVRKSDMQFEAGAAEVEEGICKHFKLISWLVNHEMVLLSMATSLTFYFKYLSYNKIWKLNDYVGLFVPVLLTIIVFIIADSTYSYKKLKDDYTEKWHQYIDNVEGS